MDFMKILNSSEYDFIREDKILGNNILMLTLGGSHGYGTNTENSDIDFRGICYNPKEQLLGFYEFEQFVHDKTDTVFYGLKKIITLLLNCNPNTIELLGCREEDYLILNKDGKLIKDNVDLFLSQKAINSFGGYAHQQLRRLQNALARDRVSEELKEKHIKGSIENQMISFNDRYKKFENENFMKVEVVNSKLCFSGKIEDYPLREFLSMITEMSECVRNYDKLNHRNNKKDDNSLNKHAMHLIRLYLMAIDILEEKKVVTYREKEKDMLVSIRNGFYMNEDGTYKQEFFELMEGLVKKFDYAKKHTNLPVSPDYNKVQQLVMEINQRYLNRL